MDAGDFAILFWYEFQCDIILATPHDTKQIDK